MTTRLTRAVRSVNDEANKAPWWHNALGLALVGWTAYRIESHTHADGDRVEHWITAGIAFAAVAALPHLRQGVIALAKGLAPFLPFGRRGGDANSTIPPTSGRAGPKSGES